MKKRSLNQYQSANNSINENPLDDDGDENTRSNNHNNAANAAPAPSEQPPNMMDSMTGEPFTPIGQQPSTSHFFSDRRNMTMDSQDDSCTAIYQQQPRQSSGNNNNTSMLQASSSALTKLVNVYRLDGSPEVLSMAAQQAFSQYQFDECLKYCQSLLQSNSMQGKVAFCYVSTLVQLGQKRTLFRLAHQWVEAGPKEAQSWFAVGAYYYACERYHV